MSEIVSLSDALALTEDGDDWVATVQPGYDVFGIPHGGYLAALGAHAVLQASGQPDLFTITTHYLRKAKFAPMRLSVHPTGASRRFGTWSATARQDGDVVLAIMASVGDRSQIAGPRWYRREAPELPSSSLMGARLPSAPPIAERANLMLDRTSAAYIEERQATDARLAGTVDFTPCDQLAAIITCDIAPPAVWNVLGAKGWVPTVELTAHVRARPAPGTMKWVAETRYIADGFLEEDAEVFDSTGALVVQSRQLARWTEMS